MAFLCNENKFFWVKNLPSTEQISPGFYIPQSIHRKIKKSFVPFGSNVQKEAKIKIDDIPLNHSKNIYLFNMNDNKKIPFNKNNKQNLDRNLNILTRLKTQDDIPGEEVKKNYLIIDNFNKINKEEKSIKINKNKKKMKTHPKIVIDANFFEKEKKPRKKKNNLNCMIYSINDKKYKKERSVNEID